MEYAAILKDNVVINNIVIAAKDLWGFKNSPNFDGDDLIACSREVEPGDTFDPNTGIFWRDGVRIYPEKTDTEKISDLEQEITDIQLALCNIYESR